MCSQEKKLAMVQIDDPRRHAYIKFFDYHRKQKTLTSTKERG